MISSGNAIIAFGIVWLIASLAFGIFGNGNWQVPCDADQMIFRTPWKARVGAAGLASWFCLIPLWLAPLGCFSPNAASSNDQDVYYLMMVLVLSMALGLGYFIFYASRPQETRIDLDQRICFHSRGWAQKKSWTIPLSEIDAVYINYTNSLLLRPKLQGQSPVWLILAMFGGNRGMLAQIKKARQTAQEIADRLGIVVKEDPLTSY